MKNFTIAIIDSGLGGLSLFDVFLSQLDVKNYIYFADLKNLPYGLKTREELICLTLKNIKTILNKYKPNAIVFGCNTIGTTIFKYIKNSFPDLPLFTIKPNLEESRLSINQKTLVIATTATINALSKTKEYLANKQSIVLCKMPRLASKVENYIQNGTNLVPYLTRKLKHFKNINRIILGCTHYYFVKDVIANMYPKAQIVDGTFNLSNEIKSYFHLKSPDSKVTPRIKWELTSNKSAVKDYKKIIQRFTKNQNK